jgi:putative membrane protein
MKRTAVILGCLLLATPSLAQKPDEKMGTTAAAAITTEDFVRQVAISDLFEVASAKLAQTQGTEMEKKFASQMIEDHTKTSAELKRMIVSGTPKPDMPSQIDQPHQAKLDKLNSSRGQDFAAVYASQQVEAHQDAVALFERYNKSGDRADLKDWAGKTLPALKHHLEMAQQLDGHKATAPTVGSGTAK